jgi:predicted metalloendopeptidase
MDEARAEKLGITPIEAELARIDAIKDRGQLVDYLARVQLLSGVPPFDGRKRPSNFIDAQIMADAKDPGINTIWVTQGGFRAARA